MAGTATYEIAGTDELEALGRDEVAFDTSAGLHPDDHVAQEEYEEAPSSSKSRVCVILAIIAIALTATGVVLGVVFARRNNGGNDVTTTIPGQGSTQPSGGTGSQAPDAATTAPVTAAPATTEATTATTAASSSSNEVKKYTINVITKVPHDSMAFTQGFEYSNGVFYESTGLRGQSSLRKVEIETGKVLQRHDFADMTLFGEGLTLHKSEHIFMLTWTAGRGFVFNQTSFDVIKEWKYEGQGWGLCLDREKDEVYMSDGTTQLRVLDPEDLSEIRRIKVTLKGKEVDNLNELEWICGEVWANVWMTSKIYRIDPTSGRVKSIIDAGILPLKADRRPSNDVLNGIALDREKGRLWLTGKKWPVVYQVSVTDDSLDLTSCK